jgi:hypothetical protein
MNLTRGEIAAPVRMMIYGQGGVGKTSLAASAPGVAFVQGEEGTRQFDVARFPLPESWADVLAQVHSVAADPVGLGVQTLVIDTLDGLEPLLWRHVCQEGRVTKLDLYGKGFGKGLERAAELVKSDLLTALDKCVAAGVAAVILSHAKIKSFKNPLGEDFDRWVPNMAEKAWGAVYNWCDVALFAQVETLTAKEGNAAAKAVLSGNRILNTLETGAFAAKNRRDMPAQLPLLRKRGWAVVAPYLQTFQQLREQIVIAAGPDSKQMVEFESWALNIDDRHVLVETLYKLQKERR